MEILKRIFRQKKGGGGDDTCLFGIEHDQVAL